MLFLCWLGETMNCSISISSRESAGVAFAVLSKAASHALPGRTKRSKTEDGRIRLRRRRLCLQVLREETEAQQFFFFFVLMKRRVPRPPLVVSK